MRELWKRCRQCRTGYNYQASGEGCQRAENDEHYCPGCKTKVCDALAGVKRRFECRYANVSTLPEFEGLTLQHLLDWEKEALLRRDQPGVVKMVPVWFGAVGEYSREVVCQAPWRGQRVRLTTSKEPHPTDGIQYRIEVEREWDLLNKCFTGERW